MRPAWHTDEELLIAVANTAHGERDEFAGAAAVRSWWRSTGAPARRGAMAPESRAMLRSPAHPPEPRRSGEAVAPHPRKDATRHP